MASPVTYTSNLNIAKPYQNQSVIDTNVSVADDIFDTAVAGRLALSVAGSADVTLTDAVITGAGTASNKILEFTGVLTGSINVIVPTKTRHYIVFNNTTGAFTLNVKTVAGVGIIVSQGVKAQLYCDGTNVVIASPTGFPQTSKSAAYTTVLSDAGKMLYHPSADTTARVFTIDSNANVPYPIGSAITVINQINTVTIAITSDTMTLFAGSGTGTTGSRTLAAGGIATATKVASTAWVISGVGLT